MFTDRQRSIDQARAIDLTSTDATFSSPTRSIYVGTGGDLIVELSGASGVQVTYKVLAGQRQVISASKVIKIGTTASNLVAEF
jgi:hypothetical protein